jgi:hypothetical protein
MPHRSYLDVARPDAETLTDAISQCRRILKSDGLWAGMSYLNGVSPYRYSAVFRFDGGMLRNVCLVDRQQPQVRDCPEMPVTESYCVYVRDTGGEFGVEHAHMDCRVIGHPKAGRFQSYYGVPLLADDGQLVGTVCHFDEAPVTLEPAISVVLNEIAPFVTDLVSRNT